MAKGFEVLSMLRPNGGWIIEEDDFDSIQWIDCEPVTKTEFKAGFSKYDAWKAKQDEEKAKAKASAEAKLEALGITIDDLRSLLS